MQLSLLSPPFCPEQNRESIQHLCKMGEQKEALKAFTLLIRHFYAKHRRQFPWRENITPYKVVVSEIMLQQTQTHRVEKKFSFFIEKFPSFQSLASAYLPEVLAAWSGLGYNKRAKALYDISKKVTEEWKGEVPPTPSILQTLPHIGPHTAASIVAFAYNLPTAFIETNIRSVYTYFFFPEHQGKISDKEIFPLVQATVSSKEPRDWYYALMDYGVFLKKQVSCLNERSLHYKKQSRFEGSTRQMRSSILKHLLSHQNALREELLYCAPSLEILEEILLSLVGDGLIQEAQSSFSLALK